MTRHWRSKGDDAKIYHLTIAVSIKLKDRLLAYAAALGRPPTVVAHDLIDRGVPDERSEQKQEAVG